MKYLQRGNLFKCRNNRYERVFIKDAGVTKKGTLQYIITRKEDVRKKC